MSRARNLADLLDANGDVASGALDNVPPSNDASALTTGTLPVERVPYVGRRNLIINGAMQVAQRGTSANTVTTAGYYTVDRWQLVRNASTAVFTLEQSIDAPVDFKNSFKTTVTATVSSGTTIYNFHRYSFEGQDIAHLNWGTSNAKTVTLSFWAKSSIAGTHGVLIGRQNEAMYPATYAINAADTWEYKTITIDGPTSGSFATDNTAGFEVIYDLGVGSTYSATAGAWDYVNNVFGVTGAVKLCETNGATIQITGVQLEVGSVATPFEHRSYGEELALCQRYYATSYPVGKYAEDDGGGLTDGSVFLAGNVTDACGGNTFPVQMRATPTLYCYHPSGGIAANSVRAFSGSSPTGLTVTNDLNQNGFFRLTSNSGSFTSGVMYSAHYTADAEL